ncbi:heavy metal-binding domain-containing protein [Flavivirga amylovorans]|uniref:Heavy metal-binding domain-containing protein n=1 Tax=Flavivirga amylovorans TaxID=870486 RepID=A0ABT8X5J4_9FLAO|nr:heavy metal-binding domain-containing protein [Flavivirga amylovorans]MDO5989250.1 heavy metal-binding domain-containing protein [Flavivirga amylovorans]
MVLTTTNSIEGHTIQDYLGIVTGINVSMPKATFSFSMNKYYQSYEKKVGECKEEAFQKLKSNAINLKANAVVGISIDVEANPTSGLIIVSITGTAVKII